jgi:hypothetical protein
VFRSFADAHTQLRPGPASWFSNGPGRGPHNSRHVEATRAGPTWRACSDRRCHYFLVDLWAAVRPQGFATTTTAGSRMSAHGATRSMPSARGYFNSCVTKLPPVDLLRHALMISITARRSPPALFSQSVACASVSAAS